MTIRRWPFVSQSGFASPVVLSVDYWHFIFIYLFYIDQIWVAVRKKICGRQTEWLLLFLFFLRFFSSLFCTPSVGFWTAMSELYAIWRKLPQIFLFYFTASYFLLFFCKPYFTRSAVFFFIIIFFFFFLVILICGLYILFLVVLLELLIGNKM